MAFQFTEPDPDMWPPGWPRPNEKLIEFREAVLRAVWKAYQRHFKHAMHHNIDPPPVDSNDYKLLLKVAATLMRIKHKSDEDWTADELASEAIEGAEFWRKRFDGRMSFGTFAGGLFLDWLRQQFIPDDTACMNDLDSFGRDVPKLPGG